MELTKGQKIVGIISLLVMILALSLPTLYFGIRLVVERKTNQRQTIIITEPIKVEGSLSDSTEVDSAPTKH